MTNQAYLKIYEDMACTKELKQGFNNDYIINVQVPTGYSNINYKKNLYVKNVGTHTAYNIVSSKNYDSSSKATVTLSKSILHSKESALLQVSINYTKGDKVNHQVQVTLDYDNIP